MNIHEYQSKNLFSRYGIPVPRGEVATTVDDVDTMARSIGGKVLVKAQIHAGGRGKAGGIVACDTPQEAGKAAEKLLDRPLVTKQTGPEGKLVRRVLVEEAVTLKKELYFSILIDRSRGRECPIFLASSAGGTGIEDVPKSSIHGPISVPVVPGIGYRPFHGRILMCGLGIESVLQDDFSHFVASLYRLFVETNATLIEVNPLGITDEGKLMALDAKVTLDDDGLFRHPELRSLRDKDEEDPLESLAASVGVSYIKLDGTIGCMVNGAGLAMATMDSIKLAGGEPANFLDVGGGASAEKVEQAFRILTADSNVNAVLVNIFGGILRCDRVASGLIEAATKVPSHLPLVVRLQGTNVEEGRRLLKESSVTFIVAEELSEAAEQAVQLSR